MSVETPELRAELSTADINDLDDDAFAYIEPGGEKDDEGKTTPRSLRHYPVQDKAHADNALARADAAIAGDDETAKNIAEKALPKIKAAVAKFAGNAKRSVGRSKERHRAVPLVPEIRVYATEGLEIREADTAGNLVTITGAPIVYDTWYPVVDRKGEFQERMLPGVATDVLATDVRFLFNHDPDKVMARAGGITPTLSLEDSPTELRMNATVDIRQSYTNDLVIAIERGDVNQMSVGFLCDKDEWNRSRDERSVKHFKTMPDLSSVTYPASPTTSVEIAQRMAQAAGAEPGARIRRLYADYRAGQVLSATNKGVVIDAVKALHGVLQSAGFDPADLIEGEEPGDGINEIGPTDDGPMGASDDGAIGGNALPAGDGAGPDARTEFDPGEKVRGDGTNIESRDAPTPEDYSITQGLADLKAHLARVKAMQLADPDYKTDPDDQAVMDAIEKAEADIDTAIVAQSKDSRRDPKDEAERKSSAVLTELRAQYRVREYRRIVA